MDIEEVLKRLRKLAKTLYWQTIYNGCKEANLQLFYNKADYTNLQIYFLNNLALYNNLFLDIAMKEVDERVMEDIIYEDAYLYWKRNKPKDDYTTNNKNSTTSRWVFKKTGKKVN